MLLASIPPRLSAVAAAPRTPPHGRGGAIGHPGAVETPGSALTATGERTAPGLALEEYWFARHEVAYRWIADRLRRSGSRIVVDAGAGEGYGTAMLAPAIALEYDAAVCRHLRTTYPQVAIAQANLGSMPLRTRSVDAIVCLQVIEHLWDLPGFLRDCRRALRPDGELIVTTPQRLTFSPGLGRGEKPVNPFHVEEFDAEQLRDLLVVAGFDDIHMRGIHHGARIANWEASHGSVVAAQVAAATSGAWPDHVRSFVETVTAEDFDVDRVPVAADADRLTTSQDLLATAKAV